MNVVPLKTQPPEQMRLVPLAQLDPHPSGHNRFQAAMKAGVDLIPAWVRAMDDDTAFMQLVLANSQSELAGLERGLHALDAVGSGMTLRAYAEKIERNYTSTCRDYWAAEVALKYTAGGSCASLMEYTSHLTEIRAAPPCTWTVLVEAVVGGGWSKRETRETVTRIQAVAEAIPGDHADWLPIDTLAEALLKGERITPQYVAYLISEVETGDRALAKANDDFDAACQAFTAWLDSQDSRDTTDCVPALELLVEIGASRLVRGFIPDKSERDLNVETVKSRNRELLDWVRRMHKRFDERVTGQKAAVAIRKQQREEAERKARKIVTLKDWNGLDAEARKAVMLGCGGGKDLFNKQDTDLIDWAQWSWNPVTGCQHDCPYCYARDIANRWFEQGFEPSLYPGRLAAPVNTKVPDRAADDQRYRNVFACSMADLFGRWTPDEWITEVLRVAAAAPQWNFLFLTKFPKRMAEFDIPRNAWMGTTVDCQARVANAERAFEKVQCAVRWLSIEPMIEPLKFTRLDLFDWLVIGGASRSSQTPAWYPSLSWIADLEAQADAVGCQVYHKPNLFLPRREMPGDTPRPTPARAPDVFHYLGRKNGEA
jgi:protein gp37